MNCHNIREIEHTSATSNSTTVTFTLNWWNFELTVFELTMHFKHEMIGIWQKNQKKTLNQVELSINRVRINRARPVYLNGLCASPNNWCIIYFLAVNKQMSKFTQSFKLYFRLLLKQALAV